MGRNFFRFQKGGFSWQNTTRSQKKGRKLKEKAILLSCRRKLLQLHWMKHTVAYSLLPGQERFGIMAPMLSVTFTHKNSELATLALVDSGAERGLISTVYADELGIAWEKLPRYTGSTSSGDFKYRFFKDLQVEALGTKFVIDICIGEGMNAFKCILGRQDIFLKAKISFEGYKNQFSIEFRNLN